jgi:micrococcal nuclease
MSEGPSATSSEPVGIPAEAQEVAVSKHTDGDTLHVVPKQGPVLEAGVDITVRLLEIDTPESVDPNTPVECYADKASDELARLLPIGATAWVVRDRELLDPYGRTLLYLWTDAGEFVNLSLVKNGFATAVLFEPNDMFIHKMRSAQRHARKNKLGLWNGCAKAQAHSLPGGPDASASTDPRFDYCYEANAAGYGNYVRSRDAEYDWYDDSDQDGVACEF